MHHPMLRPRLNESADTTRSRPESPPAKPTETDRKPLLTRYQARHGLDESPHRIDAYVPCLLSGLLTASDRLGSASSACLIGVVAGAPRTRAFRRGRVRCASRRRPAAVSIGRRQHPRRMGSARFELGALRLELYRLLVAPRLLAPLALGFALGKGGASPRPGRRGRRACRAPSRRPAARKCPGCRRWADRRCLPAAERRADGGRRRKPPRAVLARSSASVASPWIGAGFGPRG
jgi:hypothetical protein